jgi:hypothetical protein
MCIRKVSGNRCTSGWVCPTCAVAVASMSASGCHTAGAKGGCCRADSLAPVFLDALTPPSCHSKRESLLSSSASQRISAQVPTADTQRNSPAAPLVAE